MTLNEALKNGKKVCVLFRDDQREINCPIIMYQPNNLAEVLNTIVGEVYEVKNPHYDYEKVLYVSVTAFDELVLRMLPTRKGQA